MASRRFLQSRTFEIGWRSVSLIALAVVLGGCSGYFRVVTGPARVNNTGQIEILEEAGGDGEGNSYRILTISNDGTFDSAELDGGGVSHREEFEPMRRDIACLPDDSTHCFRVGETPFLVEETVNGIAWTTSWSNAVDAHVLSERNSFEGAVVGNLRWWTEGRSVAIRRDGTVFVTTGVGPLLTWTADEGWTPAERSVRQPVLGKLILLALAGAALSIPVSQSFWVRGHPHRKARNLLAQAVFGLSGAIALFSYGSLVAAPTVLTLLAQVYVTSFAVLFAVLGLVAMGIWRRDLTYMPRRSVIVFATSVVAMTGWISYWYFGPGISVARPALAPGVVLALATCVVVGADGRRWADEKRRTPPPPTVPPPPSTKVPSTIS